jgi:ribosomal protein S10
MLLIYIKTYNNFLLHSFFKKIKNQSQLKNIVQFTLLPSKRKSFVIKKSPHVFGRSKEKYYLSVYGGVIRFKSLRRKDLLFVESLVRTLNYKEGLGFKFIFK